MDVITILLILVTTVNAALGFVLLFNNSRVSKIYSINILTIIGWSSAMIIYRFFGSEDLLYLTKILYSTATLIASTFLYFTYLFPYVEKALTFKKSLLIFLPNVFIVALTIFSDTVIRGVTFVEFGENVVEFGNLFLLFAFYILFYFNFAFWRLYKKYKSTKEPLQKRQIFYFSLGYIISANISFVTNMLLPWFWNYFELAWFGQISTILMVTFATYAIFKHHLFEARIVLAEMFVFFLWVFILIRTLISQNLSDQIVNGGLLVVTIILGVFLIKSVVKEIETRERIEKLADDLGSANERLKELDNMKNEFISFATHQIRSPLTAIKGYGSLILEGDYGEVSKTLREPVRIIYKSSENLIRIVGEFLDISRIEQGRMKYDLADFDVLDLVHDVTESLRPNVEEKGLTLKTHSEKEKDYTVNADLGKMRQIVGNVIDNAVKYTPKGSINVEVSRKGGKILISIKDTGVGISKDDIPKLFSKFTRADNTNVNINGTGLGLFVAREMLKKQDGRIWVESEGLGKGSLFSIELKAK
jgi:signal transduction histidine kinase